MEHITTKLCVATGFNDNDMCYKGGGGTMSDTERPCGDGIKAGDWLLFERDGHTPSVAVSDSYPHPSDGVMVFRLWSTLPPMVARESDVVEVRRADGTIWRKEEARWWTEEAREQVEMWLRREFGEDVLSTQWRSYAVGILTALTPHVEAYRKRFFVPDHVVSEQERKLELAFEERCQRHDAALRAEAFEEAKRIVSGLYKNPKRYESQYDEGFDYAIDLAEQALDRASTAPTATPEAT